MKLNTSLRWISLLISEIWILCSVACANGVVNSEPNNVEVNQNDIKKIEDLDKLNVVLSQSLVEYSESDYNDYADGAEYFGFDEKIDDKITYKLMYKSDDYEVAGYIAAPADYLKKDYPVLIYVRGGNREFGELSPGNVADYTNFGFIVMATQYRGNDGGTGTEDYGGDDVQDVISLIDIAEQLSFCNGKIYMYGTSRGGLEAYCTLKEESQAGRDRISASAVAGGISDLKGFYQYRQSLMQSILVTLVGGTPEELPDEYERRSAVCWPELINTPLLIIHGKTDTTVPVEQAESIYNLLKGLDKNVELRLYDEGHGDFPAESYLDAFEWLLSY